ncbi:MAG: ABC transporter permease, partial [Chloroflexota bacterium]
QDLTRAEAGRVTRLLVGWSGLILVILMFTSGSLDAYSFMVEFNTRGGQLEQRIIEHITFVSVSLFVGFVLGVSLGLWAARSTQVAPVILYAVGIIQTIPSLALFGLFLPPLASFGDQLLPDILSILVVTGLVAAIYAATVSFLRRQIPDNAFSTVLIIAALLAAVPLTLFTTIFVSFLYQISLQRLLQAQFHDANNVVLLIFGVSLVLWSIGRFVRMSEKREDYIRYAGSGAFVIGLIGIVVLLVDSARVYLGTDVRFETLEISRLGISGIGVAPALIALTLYSLLPMVRNTYAGLNNVDPAIIDSGRGMGMTATQIFFRIELPLAFPVIMAGVRNAGVALIGIGTIAQIIGGGGLGDFVLRGINNTSIDQILLGLVPAVILALILDFGLRAIENLLTSPGIRQVED